MLFRSYKKAVSTERALQILGFEVKDGHIDGELVRLFEESEVYRVLDEPSRWRYRPSIPPPPAE